MMGSTAYFIKLTFLGAALFYLLSVFLHIAGRGKSALSVFSLALFFNLVSISLRYWLSFPMLPLYQGPFFIPFCIGIIVFRKVSDDFTARMIFFSLISALSLAALFFPNDYYLPFIQFKTLLSHLFFIFGVMGKAFFLAAGGLALHDLIHMFREKSVRPFQPTRRMVIWGFCCWTLSVFSGAVWSYLGWGSPLVWDDPVIATTMASWLYYSLLLHLHLLGEIGSAKKRLVFVVAGSVWVFLFNCIPDMGKFVMPNPF